MRMRYEGNHAPQALSPIASTLKVQQKECGASNQNQGQAPHPPSHDLSALHNELIASPIHHTQKEGLTSYGNSSQKVMVSRRRELW